jgi:uncharacterized membrane protein YdjX (TVP38/TMEM64 family)
VAARAFLEGSQRNGWGLPGVVALFILGGAVSFPVLILIVTTAALFGPWLGLAYSSAGIAASATLFYFIGSRIGRERLAHWSGKRWVAVDRELRRRGVLAVVALRVLPVAPFTIVNLAFGASGITFAVFACGTIIGMTPGLTALCFLGRRIGDFVIAPSAGEFFLLLVAGAIWIAITIGAQAILSRYAKTLT